MRVPTPRTAWSLTLLLVAGAIGGSACRTARAATPVERPALDVPPPPPRVIAPVTSPDQPPMLEPVDQLPPASGDKSPARPRPPRPKPDPQTAQDTKGDPIEAAVPQPPPVSQPTSPLRLESPNSSQLASQVREALGRARGMLSKVERNRLGTEGRRKAYDSAHMFVQQAEDALKQNNLVAAKELAEKAERLAKEL